MQSASAAHSESSEGDAVLEVEPLEADDETDVVVAIDEVFDLKVKAIWNLESQIESLWATGNFEKVIPVPTDPEEREKRRQQLEDRLAGRNSRLANKYRDRLIEIYGDDVGTGIKYAEAFELCEYGRQPDEEALLAMFPIR